jgi:hypothetical protein
MIGPAEDPGEMASGRPEAVGGAQALLALAFLGVAVAAMLWLAGRPVATDDLWWHLALGEAYTESGLSLDEDPLFHTAPGQPTVPHEWLFQVGVHGVERTLGFHGLRAFHVLLVVAILGWSFALFRRAAGAVAPAALACAVLIALSWYRLFQLRPELVSLLAILALYSLVLARDEAPGRGRLAAVLLLFVVWANAHSIFAVGLALLIAAVTGVGLEALLARWTRGAEAGADRDRLLRLALLLGIAAGVTALNPRGFDQHTTFFTESASGDIWLLRDDFLPWRPLEPARHNIALSFYSWLVADALLLVFLATAATAAWRWLRERSPEALRALDLLHLGLAAAGLVAMLVAARFHWLALFPLLYVLRALRLRASASAREAWAWVCAGACAVVALSFPRGVSFEAYHREVLAEPEGYLSTPWLDSRYCGPAMRFLRDEGFTGRMIHPFNLGGFLGFWLAPELRTFIDGRLDHVPSEVLDDYIALRNAARLGYPRRIRRILDRWEVDVFVGTTFPSTRYNEGDWVDHVRRMHEWVPAYVTQTCAVLLRRAPRNRENLARAAAWWERQGIAFSERDGPDVATAIQQRPDWAVREGILPPGFARMARAEPSPDREERIFTLGLMAETLWRVGAFEPAARVDSLLLEIDPDAPLARWRLGDSLLNLRKPAPALEVLTPLCESDPGWRNVATLCGIARARLSLSGDRRPGRPLRDAGRDRPSAAPGSSPPRSGSSRR